MYIEGQCSCASGSGGVGTGGSAVRVGRRFCLAGLLALLVACSSVPPSPAKPGNPPLPTPAPLPVPDPVPVAAVPAPERGQESPRENVVDPPAIREGRSVFFGRGSAELDAAAHAVLEAHAARLNDDPKLVVTLVGHSDHMGSRSYNVAVAEQRAAAVARALREMGVHRSQIRRYSLGSEKPGVQCQKDPCRSKLRRVDLVYPKPRAPRRVGLPAR